MRKVRSMAMLERETNLDSVKTRKKNHFIGARKQTIEPDLFPSGDKNTKFISDEKKLKHEKTINYLKEKREEKQQFEYDPLHPKRVEKETARLNNDDDIIALLKRRAD